MGPRKYETILQVRSFYAIFQSETAAISASQLKVRSLLTPHITLQPQPHTKTNTHNNYLGAFAICSFRCVRTLFGGSLAGGGGRFGWAVERVVGQFGLNGDTVQFDSVNMPCSAARMRARRATKRIKISREVRTIGRSLRHWICSVYACVCLWLCVCVCLYGCVWRCRCFCTDTAPNVNDDDDDDGEGDNGEVTGLFCYRPLLLTDSRTHTHIHACELRVSNFFLHHTHAEHHSTHTHMHAHPSIHTILGVHSLTLFMHCVCVYVDHSLWANSHAHAYPKSAATTTKSKSHSSLYYNLCIWSIHIRQFTHTHTHMYVYCFVRVDVRVRKCVLLVFFIDITHTRTDTHTLTLS